MAALLLFPPCRRVADVRRCAINLDRLHGAEATKYWKCEMAALAVTMTTAGAGQDEVGRQLLLFTAAVQEELLRLYAERSGNGGDAA